MSENYKPHEFNPEVAELYGVNAALIFRYLSFCTANGRWASPTLADLCNLYPYLGEWQIWAALKKLTSAGRKTPPLVLRKCVNDSYLYRVIAPDTCLSPHTFDVDIALKAGVLSAIMYQNIGHWIRTNWKRRAEAYFATLVPEDFDCEDYQMQRHAYQMTRGAAAHYTSAADWVKEHPYATERSAKRSFSGLQRSGLIRKGLRKRHRQLWLLTRKTLNEYEQDMLRKSILGDSSAKTQTYRPKPKGNGQNPKATAKTQNEPGLSDSTRDRSDALIEADIEEGCLEKPIADNAYAFRAPSLADASANAGTAYTAASPRSAWGTPNFPRKSKTVAPRTRRFKPPVPDDPEYYEYLDTLTEKQRLALSS